MERKFNIYLAKIAGIKAAIVVDYICEGEFVKEFDEDVRFIDGRPWFRCSQRTIARGVGCMSQKAVSNAIDRLLIADMIDIAELSDDPFDHSYWYCLTDTARKVLSDDKFAVDYIRYRDKKNELWS